MSDKILVNGRFLTPKINGGVKRFSVNVVRELSRLAPDRYLIVCPKDADTSLLGGGVDTVSVGAFKGKLGILWEQISLPAYARRSRAPLLSLCNVSPRLYGDYVVLHDVIWAEKDMMSARNEKEKKWAARMDRLTKAAVRQCRRIFTVSEFSKSRISALYGVDPDRISVIYTACDHCRDIVPEPCSGVPTDGDYYLSVSSLMGNKNFAYVEKLAAQTPNELFCVVGRPLNYSASASLPNVRYLGELSDGEMAYCYAHCKAYITPSLYEGFGITPLEALAFGCRRLYLSDIPVFREIYDGVANFFDPRDTSDFARAEKEGGDADGSAVRALMSKYTWANVAGALDKAISADELGKNGDRT